MAVAGNTAVSFGAVDDEVYLGRFGKLWKKMKEKAIKNWLCGAVWGGLKDGTFLGHPVSCGTLLTPFSCRGMWTKVFPLPTVYHVQVRVCRIFLDELWHATNKAQQRGDFCRQIRLFTYLFRV